MVREATTPCRACACFGAGTCQRTLRCGGPAGRSGAGFAGCCGRGRGLGWRTGRWWGARGRCFGRRRRRRQRTWGHGWRRGVWTCGAKVRGVGWDEAGGGAWGEVSDVMHGGAVGSSDGVGVASRRGHSLVTRWSLAALACLQVRRLRCRWAWRSTGRWSTGVVRWSPRSGLWRRWW